METKKYEIIKPHYAIDSRYDGNSILMKKDSNGKYLFLPWFSTSGFSGLDLGSVQDCLNVLKKYVKDTKEVNEGELTLFTMIEDKGFDVYFSSKGYLPDHSEKIENCLNYLATIKIK